MANKIYWSKTALTGGAAGALDSIDGASLTDGDFAHVTVSGVLYIYKLDADSAAAESSPGTIAPDANAGDKRWVLQNAYQPLLDAANRTVGDLLTETAAGTMGAIAAVAAGNYFKSAGVATLPAWGKMSLLDTGVKVGLITLTDAAATQAVTGVGFKPSAVIFLSAHTTAGTFDDFSIGIDDGTTAFSIMSLSGDASQSSGYSINHYIDSTHFLSAKITTLGTDGFTLTKYQGSTAGSGHSLMVGYLAFP